MLSISTPGFGKLAKIDRLANSAGRIFCVTPTNLGGLGMRRPFLRGLRKPAVTTNQEGKCQSGSCGLNRRIRFLPGPIFKGLPTRALPNRGATKSGRRSKYPAAERTQPAISAACRDEPAGASAGVGETASTAAGLRVYSPTVASVAGASARLAVSGRR